MQLGSAKFERVVNEEKSGGYSWESLIDFCICHFLFLEKKKVTKENSRTKEWLRPFVRPTHKDSDGLMIVY